MITLLAEYTEKVNATSDLAVLEDLVKELQSKVDAYFAEHAVPLS
jgi:hypothetical protein